jgi:hypothetical protein
VIADLIGKGKHIRTVPVPAWAKRVVDEWTDAASISTGALFRRVGRLGKIWGGNLTPKAIWHIVKAAAKRAEIKNLAPHHLRRTCARLCHLAGGELEQIQKSAAANIMPGSLWRRVHGSLIRITAFERSIPTISAGERKNARRPARQGLQDSYRNRSNRRIVETAN